MNKLDHELMNLLKEIMYTGQIKISQLPKQLINYIGQKYKGKAKLFNYWSSENYMSTDDSFFIVDYKKLKLSASGKKKISENTLSYSLELEDYLDSSKFIIGLGKKGHDTYDYLEDREQKEKTQEIMENQNLLIKKQSLIMLLVIVLSAGSLLVSIGLMSNSINVGNKQIELIDSQINTMVPLDATLGFWIDNVQDKYVPIERISKIDVLEDGREVINEKDMAFIVNNYGRMDTGSIYATLSSPIINDRDIKIDTIPGESSSKLSFKVSYKDCNMLESESSVEKVNPLCDYRNNDINTGWYDFKLTVHCDFCNVKNLNQVMPVCIYKNEEERNSVCI